MVWSVTISRGITNQCSQEKTRVTLLKIGVITDKAFQKRNGTKYYLESGVN